MRKLHRLKNIRLFLCLFVLLFLIFSVLFTFNVRFNYTPSMPIGFYQRVSTTKIKRGDLVVVCLPKQVAVVALQRGYLRGGSCPNKVIPVLKQVIAIPGDVVTLTNSHITVNSTTYIAPFNSIDHNRQPLQKFIQNGIYQPSRGYWIYGANDPIKSWDSRYYGSVKRAEIIAVYKPLFTF